MNEVLISMAISLFSTFGQGKSGPSIPVANKHRNVAAEVAIFPGRLADLQKKLFFINLSSFTI